MRSAPRWRSITSMAARSSFCSRTCWRRSVPAASSCSPIWSGRRVLPAGGSPPRTGTVRSPCAPSDLWRRPGAEKIRRAALELFFLARRQHDRSSVLGRRALLLARGGWVRGDRAALAARRPRHFFRAQALIVGMASAGKGQIETLVTFLEMTEPPARAPLPPPCAGIEVRRALRPTISFYRYLYDAIGKDWTWYERKLLGDADAGGDHPRSQGRGERAVGRRRAGRPRRARPSRAARRRARLFRCACPSSSARGSAASCSTGRSTMPGERGRGASGCTPAISTTRARSASTRRPAFGSTTGALTLATPPS